VALERRRIGSVALQAFEWLRDEVSEQAVGRFYTEFGYRLNYPERPGSLPMPGIIFGRSGHDLAAARRPVDGGSDGDGRPGRLTPVIVVEADPPISPLRPIVSRCQPGLMPFGCGIPSSCSSRALRTSSRARSVP
jgi:hypothetical protein